MQVGSRGRGGGRPNDWAERFLRRYIATNLEIYVRPSYLQCTKRLLAAIQLRGVLPQSLLRLKHDHISL